MDDIDAALTLLDGIAFRDKLEEEERIPAWRAIKLLYRNGLAERDCQEMVRAVQMLGSQKFGPTLAYYLRGARWDLGRFKVPK